MQMPAAKRSAQSRLAVIIAILIGTALASAIAALTAVTASSAAATAPPSPPSTASTAQAVTLGAFDVTPPTPVDITFAKPEQPRQATASRNRPQSTRTVRPAHVAAATSSLCTGAGWVERRGAAAQATLLNPTPAGVTVSFLPGGGDLKGMTYYDRHHVDVFVGTCSSESDALLRHVVAHEMGHAWDSLSMTDELRARYLEARGIAAGTPWFGCDTCQDFATPAGDFAETYAQWQRGASDSRSTMAAPATPAQLASLGAEFFS